MDIVAAIEQAEQDLADRLTALEDAKQMVTMLDTDVKNLRLELTGLRSYASRKGLSGQRDIEPAELGDNVHPISGDLQLEDSSNSLHIATLTRAEAVTAILETTGGEPLDRNQIHELFFDHGRYDDTLDQISLALSGLKRGGKAQKLGHGKWALVDAGPTRSTPTAEAH